MSGKYFDISAIMPARFGCRPVQFGLFPAAPEFGRYVAETNL